MIEIPEQLEINYFRMILERNFVRMIDLELAFFLKNTKGRKKVD